MRATKDFVCVFFPLCIGATKEEVATGMEVPAFTHEGFTGEAHTVREIVPGHGHVAIEPGRRCEIFATREEAEAFVASRTVRRSGWMILART